jgi:hypothetical protein
MNSLDLDKFQKQRLTPVRKSWGDTFELKAPDIFVSRRVIETLPQDKAILSSFRLNTILPLLPFVQNLYVLVCPKCVTADSIASFSELTAAGFIIPILTAPYHLYSDSLVAAVSGFDHMSWYEFDFYRWAYVVSKSVNNLCPHCVKKRQDEFSSLASGLKTSGLRIEHLKQTFSNLRPFVSPDNQLLDDLGVALHAGQVDRIRRLCDLSYTIFSARTAQAFNAAQIVRDTELTSIPYSAVGEFDEARTGAIRLSALAADGLKIRLPVDLPIKEYIELLTDYRPKILGLTQQLLASDGKTALSTDSLLGTITSINRDIERIKGSRRYLFVEALAGFVRNNPALVASTLIAGALGLAGSLVGCVSVPIAFGVGSLAKKAGKLKGNDAAKRLGRKLLRDLQPSVDKLIARYVGTSATAMHVLSIREEVANVANSVRQGPQIKKLVEKGAPKKKKVKG